MKEVKIFNSEEFGDIRTVQLNNEIYFVGKDVATALGYADTFGALKKHIMDEDKLVCQIDSAGQKREATVINESGLYALIFGSKLESAKRFKHRKFFRQSESMVCMQLMNFFQIRRWQLRHSQL